MECTIEITCVPVGIRDGNAFLEVLAIPKCTGNASEKPNLSWGHSLKDGAIAAGFTAGGAQLTLLDVGRIKPELWEKLFGDAKLGERASPAAVAPFGSRLRDVHDLAHEFYRDAHKTPLQRTFRANLQSDALHEFHEGAIQKHGLYRRVRQGTDAISDQHQQIIVNNLSGLPAESVDAAQKLVLSRVRAQPAAVSGNSAQPQYVQALEGLTLRSPDNALVGLSLIQAHYAASHSAARGMNIQRRPNIQDAAATGNRHLVVHMARLLRHPARQSALKAHYVKQSTITQPTFNQRVTLLMNAPALLEALGLVLRFSLPSDVAASAISAGFISIDEGCRAVDTLKRIMNAKAVCHITHLTGEFLPRPAASSTGITPYGWIDMKQGRYSSGCLQLDSAAMQIVTFASQSGLRQAAAAAKGSDTFQVTRSRDEDVDHPILPPSPVTAGFYVWKDDLQNEIYQRRDSAQNRPSGQAQHLYADDLQNSFVVDVCQSDLAQDDKHWNRLCLRNTERYDIAGTHIESKDVERGVRISSLRNTHVDTTEPFAHEVDETIFTWRIGSLVGKTGEDGYKPISSRSKSEVTQDPPWKFPGPTVDPACKASPIFGKNYSTSMRAGFVTGGVVPFNLSRADILADQPFRRYEMMQGPAVVPVYGTDKRLEFQDQSVLFVASTIEGDKPKIHTEVSQCLLVPPRISKQLARWHGKKESEINTGSEWIRNHLMRRNGDLFPYYPFREPDPFTEVPEEYPPYLPDPLVQGLYATLVPVTAPAGSAPSAVELLFSENDKEWLNYEPLLLETVATLGPVILRVDPATGPFGTVRRAIRCHIPVGETWLLVLRPKLHPDAPKLHGMPGLPDGSGISALEDSDLCRATVIRLIHATDRPAKIPVFESDPTIAESSNTPPVSARVLVHPGSTSKVVLVAEWTEYVDDVTKPTFEAHRTVLQLASKEIQKTDGPIVELQGQLPFGDGKHRELKFTAIATSRYGRVLFPSLKGDQLTPRITSSSAPRTVSRKALAAPAAPDVEIVLPNLRWDLEHEHERKREMGLTIVLNRPWFSSGEGERLAVVTAVPGQTPGGISAYFDKPESENFVSAWGLYSDYRDTKIDPNAPKLIALLQTGDSTITKVGIGALSDYPITHFMPTFNKVDGQWFVNLSFSQPAVYGVVLRLAVIRYQASADADKQASPLVVCDFAFLRPGRTVIVKRKGRRKTIEIHGTASTVLRNTHIDVRRYKHAPFLLGHGAFDYEPGDLIAGGPGSGEVLWTATFNSLLRHKYLIEEWEDWPGADQGVPKASMPVYSDIVEI